MTSLIHYTFVRAVPLSSSRVEIWFILTEHETRLDFLIPFFNSTRTSLQKEERNLNKLK